MKYIFIINPLAGEGGALEKIKEGISQLKQSKDCEIYLTKAVLDATKYVKKKIKDADGEKIRFIACGGDGTINEVFEGAVGHDNVSVSVYPCGSGNDFVKTFGGQDKFLNVKSLVEAKEQKLDAMKVGKRYSFNVTNFGFDTTVAITVNTDRAKNGHGSKSSYTKGIVKALVTSMNNKCKVYADGKLLNESGKYLLCTIGNGQYVGGSFKCAPRAKTNDGLLEVCLVRPISRIRFVKILTPYTNGEHLDREDMKDVFTYCQAKEIKVEAPEGFAYSLDGEIIYENKFTVKVVPNALNVAIPK